MVFLVSNLKCISFAPQADSREVHELTNIQI